MEKLRYEVDPHNRLVAQKTGKNLDLTRFRRVLDGRFKIGPGNSLVYHIKAPMQGVVPDLNAPHQVKLRGRWSLTKKHDLKLTLDNWRRQRPGDKLTLQGEIITAEANSLLFAITTRSKRNLSTTDVLKFQGKWQADKHNRLTFRIKKGKGRHDTLIFTGIWEIDNKHRIVYRYEKIRLIRKKRLNKTLTFKGRWDITKKNRLSYNLSLDGESGFDFKTGIGILNKNYIKYEIGIGASSVKRTLILFGRWKIQRGTGLLFEIEYEKGKLKAIVFGADAKLFKRDRVKFRLKNRLAKDLGLELKLSRKLLKGEGQAFLKLLKSKKESNIYLGAAWRW